MIAEGQEAPAFTLNDHNGFAVSLANFKGQKVYVMSMRYAACFACNLRVKQASDRVAKYKEANLKILPVFNTQPEHLNERVTPKSYVSDDMPILVDPNGDAMKKYGTKSSCVGSAYGCGPIIQQAKHCNMHSALCGYFNCSMQHCFCNGTNPLAMPSDFLIDEEGKIVKLNYGVSMGDHLSWDEIDTFAGIKVSESTPMNRD